MRELTCLPMLGCYRGIAEQSLMEILSLHQVLCHWLFLAHLVDLAPNGSTPFADACCKPNTAGRSALVLLVTSRSY